MDTAPAIPITRHRFDTKPSFAPSTAARSLLPEPCPSQRFAWAIWGADEPAGMRGSGADHGRVTALVRRELDRLRLMRIIGSANSVAAMAGSTNRGPNLCASRASTRVLKLGANCPRQHPRRRLFSLHLRVFGLGLDNWRKRSFLAGSGYAAAAAHTERIHRAHLASFFRIVRYRRS